MTIKKILKTNIVELDTIVSKGETDRVLDANPAIMKKKLTK